ncbi:hypothetical protein FV225_29650, partial [Methylobacterium sp. WL93]
AGLRERPRRRAHGRRDLRRRGRGAVVVEEGELQPAQADGVRIAQRHVDDGVVAKIRPGDDGQREGEVVDAAGDQADVEHAVAGTHRPGKLPGARDAARGRLERGQPAIMRRHADAAAGRGTAAGGSIRGRAHYCGRAALKPPSGRLPRTGRVPRPRG